MSLLKVALTLTLSRGEREPKERFLNSSLSLWERVGVRAFRATIPALPRLLRQFLHRRVEDTAGIKDLKPAINRRPTVESSLRDERKTASF
jgi:hypothetical protein